MGFVVIQHLINCKLINLLLIMIGLNILFPGGNHRQRCVYDLGLDGMMIHVNPAKIRIITNR